MRIVNSLVEDFGGFELDTVAIKLHSANSQDIMLPYSGTLPEQMSSVSSAFLQVNVQPIQGAMLALVVERNGKQFRRPMEATNQEIMTLLDQFFNQQDTGLDTYWLGFEQANYMGWRQVAADYRRLLKPLMALPIQERAYLSRRLLE